MKTAKRFTLLALCLFFVLGACSSSNGKKVSSPADFAGAKIAVQSETTASDSIDQMLGEGTKIDVSRYERITQCFEDLKLGRVDAVYVDSVVASYYTQGEGDTYHRVWLSAEKEPMGVCLAKKSEQLAAAVEKAIDMLYYNGKMAEIAKKYFGDDPTAGLRNVTEEPVIPDVTGLTKKDGVFLVGSEISYPPMEYMADNGIDPMGFDIEVSAAVADLFGLRVEYKNTAWDGIFAALEKGDFDAIFSSVSITPERQAAYIMTEPYVANALCVVVKK